MKGAEIKLIRNKLGLTQKQFGKEIGVTWISVYKWEHDLVQPHAVFRAKIEELKIKADAVT